MISLTPQQERAIQYIDTPLLIVAAPGTGKTRVIINKILYLVDELGYDPIRLLESLIGNEQISNTLKCI